MPFRDIPIILTLMTDLGLFEKEHVCQAISGKHNNLLRSCLLVAKYM